MSTRDKILGVLLASVAVSGAAFAQTMPVKYGFGSPVTEQELSKYFSIPADGRGLPPGSGNATAGAKVYAENCAACHGEKLEGNPAKGIGGDKLIGGRGSLATKTPVKTVESYWPYATTLFDYVKRSMPFSSPGTLKDDETLRGRRLHLVTGQDHPADRNYGRSDVAEGGHAKPRRLRARPSPGA